MIAKLFGIVLWQEFARATSRAALRREKGPHWWQRLFLRSFMSHIRCVSWRWLKALHASNNARETEDVFIIYIYRLVAIQRPSSSTVAMRTHESLYRLYRTNSRASSSAVFSTRVRRAFKHWGLFGLLWNSINVVERVQHERLWCGHVQCGKCNDFYIVSADCKRWYNVIYLRLDANCNCCNVFMCYLYWSISTNCLYAWAILIEALALFEWVQWCILLSFLVIVISSAASGEAENKVALDWTLRLYLNNRPDERSSITPFSELRNNQTQTQGNAREVNANVTRRPVRFFPRPLVPQRYVVTMTQSVFTPASLTCNNDRWCFRGKTISNRYIIARNVVHAWLRSTGLHCAVYSFACSLSSLNVHTYIQWKDFFVLIGL